MKTSKSYAIINVYSLQKLKRSVSIVNWQKIAPGVIAVLAIIDGGLVIHNGNVRSRIPSARAEYSRLKSSIGKQKYTLKHPVIRKTIPSAYKKMMMDGGQVQKAENKLINIAYRHHGKLIRKGSQYQHANQVLQQYVSSTGSTDDNIANDIWTNHLKDTVQLVPGTGNASGDYECAFIVKDKKGNIDNVITSTYESSNHIFTNFIVYGSYSVSDNTNPVSSDKRKPRKSTKHISKNRAKKIIRKHNIKKPIRKRGVRR